MNLRKVFVLVVFSLSVIVSGCGGGGGSSETTDLVASDNPTDTTVQFRLFSSSHFNHNRDQEFEWTGSNSNGGSFGGGFRERAALTQFNDEYVTVVIREELYEYRNGSTETSRERYYYQDNVTDRPSPSTIRLNPEIVGGSFDGVTITATESFPMTSPTMIGDSGAIGEYAYSNGWTLNATWELQNAGNGLAYFVWFGNVVEGNTPIITQETKHLINVNGEIQRIEFDANYHYLDNVDVNWIAIPIDD